MSYAPQESASDLLLERSSFVGGFLGNMAYGVHGTLYFVCAYLLIYRRKTVQMHSFWLLYITILFGVATVYVACGIKLSQMLWIDDRNYPGGPVAYQGVLFSNYVQILISTSYNVMTFMADGLLIYRCLLMWSHKRYVVILPILMYLVSTAMSIMMLYQAAQPFANVWTKTATNYGILFWSLSSALNISASVLIIARIQSLKKDLTDALGSEHAKGYTSISAMFVESAALYSIVSIIFVGTFARNNWFQNIVVPVLGQITCIAPLLIILRVAYGRAFTSQTIATSTGISWGTAARSGDSHEVGAENRNIAVPALNVGSPGGGIMQSGGTTTLAPSGKSLISKPSVNFEYKI